MIRRLAGMLASNPVIYELISFFLGGRISEARLRRQAEHFVEQTADSASRSLVVVDVGGGTGRLRRIWPRTARYLCLDVEMPKLRYFLRHTDGFAVLADAGRLPLPDDAVDIVISVAV